MSFCDSILIDVSIPEDNVSYLWDNGTELPSNIFDENGDSWVKVKKDQCSVKKEFYLKKLTEPPLFNLGTDTILCIGESISLFVPEGDYDCIWQDSSQNPVFTVTEEGVYIVSLLNQCGNSSDSINIYYEDCNCTPFVPTAFSPNNDGLNDVLKPISNCSFSDYNFQVFNRYGARIFNSNNEMEGWDGKHNEKPSPQGSYGYYLHYVISGSNLDHYKRGSFILIK